MTSLNLQQKILSRLEEQLGAHTQGFPLNEAEPFDLRQSSLGDRIIRWKERLQQWGLLPSLKKLPWASALIQKFYWRLTQTYKLVATDELWRVDGEEFVIKACRAILERPPDAKELMKYKQLLREGVPKEVILHYISQSMEARQFNVRLEGIGIVPKTLWKYQAGQFVKKIPLISLPLVWIYRVFKMPARFYTLVRTIQDLQDRVERLENSARSHGSVSNQHKNPPAPEK